MRVLRWTVVLVLAIGAASCASSDASQTQPQGTDRGSQASVPATASSSAPPVSAASDAAADATVPCAASTLTVSGDEHALSPTTGSHPVLFSVTNTGDGPCYLDGYPTVQLRNATGAALPFDIQNHGGLMVTAAAPKKVNVAPGSTAYFLTDQFRCDISDADHVTSAVVGLSTDAPIGTVSLSQGGSDFALCGSSDPPNEVHVSPFVSVVSDALS